MNFNILHWFHLMFGNHTNCFAMQWYWVIRMWKKWNGSQQVPVLHGISREHYATHATQLFIDRSGVPHAERKSTLFKLIVNFFLKGVVFMFWHDIFYIELLYCVTTFELVWTWNKVAVVENATKCRLHPTFPYIWPVQSNKPVCFAPIFSNKDTNIWRFRDLLSAKL